MWVQTGLVEQVAAAVVRAHRHGWAQLGVLVVHLDERSGILGLLVARDSSRVCARWYLFVTRTHASCGKGRVGVANAGQTWAPGSLKYLSD